MELSGHSDRLRDVLDEPREIASTVDSSPTRDEDIAQGTSALTSDTTPRRTH